jgi:hypothetical protein
MFDSGNDRRLAGAGKVVVAALAVALTACGGSRDDKTISKRAQLTLEPVVTELNLVLPDIFAPSDVVIGAGGSLRIADRASIVSTNNTRSPIANVGTGETNVGMDASAGDVVSIPNVVLRGANRPPPFVNIEGAIRTGGTVTRQNNARVSGAVTQNATIATRTYERRAIIPTTPGANVTLPPDTARSLAPGNYGNVVVFSRSTLTLAAGSYVFSRLQMEPQSRVVLQNANAPVVIYIRDELIYRGRIEEQAREPIVGNLLIGVLSDKQIPVEAPFLGTLLAPRATISLATVAAPGHQGAFFGKSVQVAPDVVVTHRPFPSSLIVRVDVAKNPICVNETTTINVVTQSLSGSTSGPQPEVTIDSLPGPRRTVQFFAAGERNVLITATQNKVAESRIVPITVQACAEVFPRIVVTPSVRPYEIEFTVTNATALPGTNRRVLWSFGDGQSADVGVPFTTHAYAGSLNATSVNLEFEATLTIRRDGLPDVITKKTVSIPNMYVEMAKRGFVRPPVTSTPRLVRQGKGLQGEMTIRNVEAAAVQLTSKQIERHFCDPDLNSSFDPAQTVAIPIAAGATHVEQIRLPAASFGSNICAVSLHFRGTAPGGVQLRASAHFETPARSLFDAPVSDPALRTLLNDVAAQGMVANPNRISFDDLRRLKLEQRISNVPSLQDISAGALQSGGSVIGQACDPEAPPPAPGITCQATDDWTITPPLLRNAMKGDVLIVSSCATVGNLLRTVQPPQRYSHEGIMTRNYFALAESTTAEARILGTIKGPTDIIGENELKFGFPGALRQSIHTAFNGLVLIDPEGKPQEINTFAVEPTRCLGDSTLNPPLLIRPPVDAGPEVRALLRSAADIALTTEAHYRFFGFSQANIAFDGANNFSGGNFRDAAGEVATVSTTFIWFVLKAAGVPLEGNALEPYLRPSPSGALNEVDDGAQLPTGAGITDGLYHYTVSERKRGSEYIFNSTREMVSMMQDAQSAGLVGPFFGDILGGLLEFGTNQADEIAAQFTNCFAFDKCGEDGAFKVLNANANQRVVNRDFQNPGIGTAVSPDNFLFWDTPFFGDWELVHYVSGEARRIHRFAASAGTGSVHGVVTLSDGSIVQGALVTVAGQEGASDGAGAYSFTAIPAGSYEVRARKEINGQLVFDAAIVQIDAGDDDEVNLVLTLDGPIAPPLTVTERRVGFLGTFRVFDDDNNDPIFDPDDEERTFPIQAECVVSPANRQVTLNTADFIPGGNTCVDDEVEGEIRIICELLEDDQTVRVVALSKVFEGDDCSGGGSIFDSPQGAEGAGGPLDVAADCPDCSLRARASTGGNFADLQITVTNGAGDTVIVDPIEAESRRSVSFIGDVVIHDDDFIDGNEEQTFGFNQFCFVDPLDQEDQVSFSRCVDDEVRLDVVITCNLAPDRRSVAVTTSANLFEETTCVNNDRDGDEARAVLVPACNGGCQPSSLNSPGSGLVLRVNNEDEGGDFAEINVSVTNNQAP